MSEDTLSIELRRQSSVCAAFGSPFYAALLDEAASDLASDVRRLFTAWDGLPTGALTDAAVALRFLGGLHDVVLDRADAALAAAFPPLGDAGAAWRAGRSAIERHGPRLAAFMTHEPQTNEVRRSACLLPGFLTVAAETGLPLRCLELGASAGLNQLWRRFRYRLGHHGAWGDPASPLLLDIDWRGPTPPLGTRAELAGLGACNRAPVDLGDPVQRRRLAAYVWPDQPERLARLGAAIDMAIAAGIVVETADAVDWTLANAAPAAGVATVVVHSILWQYLPAERAAALRRAIEDQGLAATAEAPFAWLRMEPQSPSVIELRLTSWPGGRKRRLATVQAHGAWIDWRPTDG